MTSKELFNALCLFRTSGQRQGTSPSELEKMEDVRINDIPISINDAQYYDVISHREYVTEYGKVEEKITSHDTSKTFRVSSDIDNFYICLYDKNNNLISEFNHQSLN